MGFAGGELAAKLPRDEFARKPHLWYFSIRPLAKCDFSLGLIERYYGQALRHERFPPHC